MNPNDGQEFWDLLLFVIVILGLAIMFAHAGNQLDKIRQEHRALPVPGGPRL